MFGAFGLPAAPPCASPEKVPPVVSGEAFACFFVRCFFFGCSDDGDSSDGAERVPKLAWAARRAAGNVPAAPQNDGAREKITAHKSGESPPLLLPDGDGDDQTEIFARFDMIFSYFRFFKRGRTSFLKRKAL